MNIYIGNLPYTSNQDDIQEMFGAFGPVVSVNLIKDRDTGNSKGFGFVEMEGQEAGEKAIAELNGKDIGGRSITVNQARPREDRSKSRPKSW